VGGAGPGANFIIDCHAPVVVDLYRAVPYARTITKLSNDRGAILAAIAS
jgi:hypothetical protein